MGSSPYWYYIPYETDLNLALSKLHEREFSLGRYNPAVTFPEFPITEDTPSPGKKHRNIKSAFKAAMEDGTRSILDLQAVSTKDEFCVARILSETELLKYFNTIKPTHAEIENNFTLLLADLERGKGLCITVYRANEPDELFFVGYSFD